MLTNSQIRILSYFLIFSLALSILGAGYVAFYYWSFTFLFSFTLLLFLGLTFFKNTPRKIFLSSYLLNIGIAGLLAIYYQSINNAPFIGGGDDELFYIYATRISKSWLSEFGIEYLAGMNYKLYIHTHAFWFDILKLFGIKDYFFFHSVLFNAFIGGLIPSLIYQITRKFFEDDFAIKAAILVAFFPITAFYSSTLLRECFVTLQFLLVVKLCISNLSTFSKNFLIFFILLLAYLTRPASAFFISIFPVIYYIISAKNSKQRIFLIIATISLVALGLILKESIYNRDLEETKKLYNELAQETAAENSLGLKLIQSNNPVLNAFSIVYLLYSPIPPPFISEFRLDYLYISFGSLMWYFILPIFFISVPYYFKEKIHANIFFSFFVFFVFSAIVVNFTSSDVRHLQPIYPLSVVFVYYYLKNNYMEVKKYIYLYLFLIPIPVFVYVFLKFYLFN